MVPNPVLADCQFLLYTSSPCMVPFRDGVDIGIQAMHSLTV